MPETKRRPGPAPRISREAVLDAARDLPPEQVTLAALGARLGVTSPALYRYFPDRTAILDALATEAREQLTPPSADLPWDEWLREAARKEKALWLRQPRLYESASYRAVASPLARITLDGLRVLIAAGFEPEDALCALTITSEVAHAIAHAESRRETAPYAPEERDELRALIGSGGPPSLDALFERSLSIAIEGLRAVLSQSRR